MKTQMRFFFLITTAIKRMIAVLDFPADIDDFIIFAQGIHDSMLASPFFAALAAKLLILQANITALRNAQVALQTNPPTGTTAERDEQLVKVQNNLRTLRGDVQEIADATPAQAENIITAAGMKVKKQGQINKQDFVAKNGAISGTAELIAKGIGIAHAAHDWAMSPDDTNWTPLTPTLQATTTVTDLTRGSTVYFRHREILKEGPTDWSQSEELLIQ